MSNVISRMFARRGATTGSEVSVAEPVAAKVPAKHVRIGLWVLSTFATIAALVAISALVIGHESAEMKVLVPLVLFWSITVCVGFAIRSALINVIRSMKHSAADKPDAALERLARMAQRERKHAAAHPQPARVLLHAV